MVTKQVKDLCKLFIYASEESGSKESGAQLKSETSAMDKRGRITGKHMNKKRQSERARQATWVEESRYHAYPRLHRSNVVTTAPVSLALPQYLLPSATGQSHNRTLGIGVHGRNTMTQSHDSYREVQLVEPHDAYRRDILLKNPDIYRSEALAIEHCDYSKRDGLVGHH
ncbi:hypothetical protein A4A49_17211 [Nicotiana attenuata]|uniref:Uncharacterized protein n=1 Tax=Nicotiana attenuata TaxID=49451 RepID=A0A314L098_NICAT|nr:hypothetical protein A4A49_17211 [Nicotiana attenuata]